MLLTHYIKLFELIEQNLPGSILFAEFSIKEKPEIPNELVNSINKEEFKNYVLNDSNPNTFKGSSVIYFFKHLHFANLYSSYYTDFNISEYYLLYNNEFLKTKNYYLNESLIILLLHKIYNIKLNDFFKTHENSKSSFLAFFGLVPWQEEYSEILKGATPYISSQNLYEVTEQFKIFTKNYPERSFKFFSNNWRIFSDDSLISISITLSSSLLDSSMKDSVFNDFIILAINSGEQKKINYGIACLLTLSEIQLNSSKEEIRKALTVHEAGSVTTTLAHLASFYINTLSKYEYSESGLTNILRKGNIDTVEFTIARNLPSLPKDSPISQSVFNYLSKTKHTQQATLETISNYFLVPGKENINDLLEFVRKLILNDKDNLNNIELFEYSITTLAENNIEDFSATTTNWLNHDDTIIHVLLERVIRLFRSGETQINLHSDIVAKWSKHDLVFVVYKVCGHFYDKEILEKFLYQIFKYGQHKVYIRKIIAWAYEEVVLLHYGGTHDFLEKIAINEDEDLEVRNLFSEIIQKHNEYSNPEILIKFPSELLIDDDVLYKIRRNFNNRMAAYKPKPSKNSILSFVKTSQLKGGKLFFHKETPTEYSNKSNMGHFEVSMEIPMGESKDPLGCRMRRIMCIEFKRPK